MKLNIRFITWLLLPLGVFLSFFIWYRTDESPTTHYPEAAHLTEGAAEENEVFRAVPQFEPLRGIGIDASTATQAGLIRRYATGQQNLARPVESIVLARGEAFYPTPEEEQKLWELLKDLRYGALRAEIAVLKDKYPEWLPEEKLLSLLKKGEQEQPLWELLRQRRYPELRRAIVALRNQDPNWVPPEELLTLLKLGEQEQPLWDLLQQQRYAELRRRINALRQQQPDWRPPPRLLALLAKGEATQMITAAAEQQDYERLIALSERYPHLFDCRRVDLLWRLADAWESQDQPERSAAIHRRIIRECPKAAERLVSLEKIHRYITADEMESLLTYEASQAKTEEEMQHFNNLRYYFYVNEFIAATNASNHGRAARYLVMVENEIQQRQDRDIASLAGWANLNADQDEKAEFWFEKAHSWSPTEETAYGLALSRYRQQDLDGTEAVIRQFGAETPRLKDLLADVLFARASQAYLDERYADALKYIDEAETYRELNRNQRLLKAWSLYHNKDYRQAQALFLSLYREQGDEDSATGLYLSYIKPGDEQQLRNIIAGLDGPIIALWEQHQANEDYGHKLFLSAEHRSPGQYPALENIDSPSISIGALLRHRSGEEGLSELTLIKLPIVEGVYVHSGVHRFALRLDQVDLDSGKLPSNALVGRPPATPGAYAYSPTTELNAGIEPHFSYMKEGRLSPYLRLGSTPLDGIVSSKLTWELGLSNRYETGYWDLSLASQPVRDSILSYTGIVDPYGGEKWGRVLETGLALSVYRRLSALWGIYGDLEISQLKGQQVADNDRVSLSVSVGRSLSLQNFDYFTVGPVLGYQTYSDNHNHFTVGHGGYFSPQQMFQLGLGLNALTEEGKSFIIKADAMLGYLDFQQDSSPFFPLAPDGRYYESVDESGIGITAEAKGVWQIADYWQLGGGLGVRMSPEYDDTYASIFLRMTFEPRRRVFSYDIPDYVFETAF